MRIKYGKKICWQRKDAYSMDSTLAPIIASGIAYFRDQIVQMKAEEHSFIGVPNGLIPGGDYEGDESWNIAWIEWQRRLEVMIYTFENWQEGPLPGDDAIKMEFGEPDENDMSEVILTHPNEFAYALYQKQLAEHNELTQEGLEYFQKHFKDMWW